VCRDGAAARASGDVEGLKSALDRAAQLHVEYTDLMVYLRLFAPAAVVMAAERLHASLDNVIDLTFDEEIGRQGRRSFTYQGKLPPGLTEVTVGARCMDHRESLINEVRGYLGLPKDAVIDRGV
jgi:hypothetical protein